MGDYHTSYKNQMIAFLIITGAYLLFIAAYTITSFFITIPWSDNPFLYVYCAYAIWFNAYNHYRFHRNSVEDEKNERKDERWIFFYKVTGLEPYNYKKARLKIFLLSYFAIAINVWLIISTRWLW